MKRVMILLIALLSITSCKKQPNQVLTTNEVKVYDTCWDCNYKVELRRKYLTWYKDFIGSADTTKPPYSDTFYMITDNKQNGVWCDYNQHQIDSMIVLRFSDTSFIDTGKITTTFTSFERIITTYECKMVVTERK